MIEDGMQMKHPCVCGGCAMIFGACERSIPSLNSSQLLAVRKWAAGTSGTIHLRNQRTNSPVGVEK